MSHHECCHLGSAGNEKMSKSLSPAMGTAHGHRREGGMRGSTVRDCSSTKHCCAEEGNDLFSGWLGQRVMHEHCSRLRLGPGEHSITIVMPVEAVRSLSLEEFW